MGIRCGKLEIDVVSDGDFWLDGGAMFGVVPRVLWEKVAPPDNLNRIQLGLNCLLVRSDQFTLLVDTGCGDKYSKKEKQIYGFETESLLLSSLGRLGVGPDDVDYVIHTHLHFDHCGGSTRAVEGRLNATFPNARYVVQKEEFRAATHPHERNRASYRKENWEVLNDFRKLLLIEGEVEILPGVRCVPSPGHTEGHQSVLIESSGEKLAFLGDLCPTSAHVPLAWVMGYDLYPVLTLQTRKEFYQRLASEKWLIVFEHNVGQPFGRIVGGEGVHRYEVAEL
jgi:glyoxylase-like metal-dependent hydrolase (beta-lactamase superfamily II)